MGMSQEQKLIRDSLEREYETDKRISKTAADKVWEFAWEYGHAYGEHEIRSYYTDLIEIAFAATTQPAEK